LNKFVVFAVVKFGIRAEAHVSTHVCLEESYTKLELFTIASTTTV